MELQELYHLIDLQAGIVKHLRQIREEINLTEIAPYLEQLLDGATAARSGRRMGLWKYANKRKLQQAECLRQTHE